MTYWIVALIVAAIVVAVLVLRRRPGHPRFAALDIDGRNEMSAEEFKQAFYADLPAEMTPDIRAVLDAVSRATGLPAGKLQPADQLGAIAAANGLQRAFLVGHLVSEFPEAGGAIMEKMAAGEFVYLHHAIALVVNARHDARQNQQVA